MEEPEIKEELAENSGDRFGLMFHLGEEGTCIIPLNFKDGSYIDSTEKICRVGGLALAKKVDFVNFVIEDNVIYTDPLASQPIADYGVTESDDLFFSAIESPELLSTIVFKLHGDYKTSSH